MTDRQAAGGPDATPRRPQGKGSISRRLTAYQALGIASALITANILAALAVSAFLAMHFSKAALSAFTYSQQSLLASGANGIGASGFEEGGAAAGSSGSSSSPGSGSGSSPNPGSGSGGQYALREPYGSGGQYAEHEPYGSSGMPSALIDSYTVSGPFDDDAIWRSVTLPRFVSSVFGLPHGTRFLASLDLTGSVSYARRWFSASTSYAFPVSPAALQAGEGDGSASAVPEAGAGDSPPAEPEETGASPTGPEAVSGDSGASTAPEADEGNSPAEPEETGSDPNANADPNADPNAASPGGSPATAYIVVTLTHDTLGWSIWVGLSVLLTLETLIFVSRALKARRAVRRMMRPISELTKAALSINATKPAADRIGAARHAITPPAPGDDSIGAPRRSGDLGIETERRSHEPPAPDWRTPDLKLTFAIDEINSITEHDLNRRIKIEDKREELQGLAAAINGMLDRVDAAYQAQLRFVSDASHELRTPISVIQGYANLLDRWGKRDEKALQESIDAIKNESESMKKLVEQLLFLARGESQSISLDIEPVSVDQLVDETVREARMIYASHDISAGGEAGLYALCDAQLVKQALRILMDNSAKFTPAGGRISVRTARSATRSGFAEISVQDSGIGISPEAISHIFDRFYRADESRARNTGGAGLGLAIAKQIIDSHGGAVEAMSRKDAGTRITMALPEARPPKPAQTAPPKPSSDHRPSPECKPSSALGTSPERKPSSVLGASPECKPASALGTSSECKPSSAASLAPETGSTHEHGTAQAADALPLAPGHIHAAQEQPVALIYDAERQAHDDAHGRERNQGAI